MLSRGNNACVEQTADNTSLKISSYSISPLEYTVTSAHYHKGSIAIAIRVERSHFLNDLLLRSPLVLKYGLGVRGEEGDKLPLTSKI